jgi:DNA-binding CsgD family transcriptional regulator/catechol 2,3-dioxygenase-like lactoylglutathione lyase family enzyme
MSGNRPRGRPPFEDALTPAEWRVVEAVRHGMSNRTIAEKQGVSLDAIKYHVANALQKLGLNSRAELRLWDGVARSSALYSTETKMDVQLAMGPLGQIARSVKDIKAARAWYETVLGLPHLYTFGDLSFFDCGGVRLMLGAGESEEPGHSILYFRVPDIRAAHAALTAKGVSFINAPHMIHRHEDGTEEWMAFFQDNEGRTLAIMAQAKG